MLTEKKIAALKAKDKAYKVGDAHQLYLLVTPSGGKLWRMNYRWMGKGKTLSFGAWPVVSLADAREEALAAKKKLFECEDPGQKTDCITFAAVALDWMRSYQATEARRKLVWTYCNRELLAKIGAREIGSITARELDDILQAVAGRSISIARICKTILHGVYLLAIRRGYCQISPVAMLKGALPHYRPKHYPAMLKEAEIGEYLRSLDKRQIRSVSLLYLRLLPLVFTRPSELRLAEWAEFDFAGKVWVIPAEKMKLRKEHIVPISRQVAELLQNLQRLTGQSRYVFCSPQTGRPITATGLVVAMRRKWRGRQTLHGFRATARTLLHERLHFSPDAIEAQLAHAVPDRLGSAYNRSHHLEERKRMMQEWADYLDNIRGGEDEGRVSE